MNIHNVKEGEYSEDKDILKEIKKLRSDGDRMDNLAKLVTIVTEDYMIWNKLCKLFIQTENNNSSKKGGKGLEDSSLIQNEVSKLGVEDDKDNNLENNSETTRDQECKESENIVNQAGSYEYQLMITLKALISNPKSYMAWHHRWFLNKSHPFDVKYEYKLISKLLKYDPRNFHCWNYRLKLNLLDKSLGEDISNYSYLHFCGKYDPLSCVFSNVFEQGCWFYLKKYIESLRFANFEDESKLSEGNNNINHPGIYIRSYENRIDLFFETPFKGRLEIVINEESTTVLIPYPMICKSIHLKCTGKTMCLKIGKALYLLEKVETEFIFIDKKGYEKVKCDNYNSKSSGSSYMVKSDASGENCEYREFLNSLDSDEEEVFQEGLFKKNPIDASSTDDTTKKLSESIYLTARAEYIGILKSLSNLFELEQESQSMLCFLIENRMINSSYIEKLKNIDALRSNYYEKFESLVYDTFMIKECRELQ